jgi:tryptophan halogenase
MYLRTFSESLGDVRTEGKVIDVKLRGEDGFIEGVRLESGEVVRGVLFVDCSGLRGLLIEVVMRAGYEEWRQWLPCDRAFAVPSANRGEAAPHTRAKAHAAGWQWRIPLQHRTGNGHVFSSEFMGEDEAAATLLAHLEGAPLSEPRLLRFVPGKRRRMWHRNCVAIGLSGGFLEPLESTGIYLIQDAIMKLIEFFPDRQFAAPDTDEFNRQMSAKFDEVRDFIILHYKASERDDSDFWKYCKSMPVPEELARRMRLFEDCGLASHRAGELFIETNWVAVYIGQGLIPKAFDPRVDCIDPDRIRQRLQQMKSTIRGAAEAMPAHAQTVARHCSAAPP